MLPGRAFSLVVAVLTGAAVARIYGSMLAGPVRFERPAAARSRRALGSVGAVLHGFAMGAAVGAFLGGRSARSAGLGRTNDRRQERGPERVRPPKYLAKIQPHS